MVKILLLKSLATDNAVSFLKCPERIESHSILKFEAMTETLEAPRGAPPSEGPPIATGTLEPESAVPLWAAGIAAVALLAVFALAMMPDAKPGAADQLTLPVLGLFAALFAWTPLQRQVAPQRDAATFAFCAALFVVYGLARRTVPESLPALHFNDEEYRFSCAAWCVFLGAVLSAPAWLKSIGGWMRALLGGLFILFVIALFSFKFIGGHYPTTSPSPIDPAVFVLFMMQTLEFAALGLCCASAAAHPRLRRLMLMALPILLWMVWARHHFAPAPIESEND